MKCPKCNKEGLNYKLFRLYPLVECKECRYYIHLNDLKEDDKTRIYL